MDIPFQNSLDKPQALSFLAFGLFQGSANWDHGSYLAISSEDVVQSSLGFQLNVY
jgi:hypothetical protein